MIKFTEDKMIKQMILAYMKDYRADGFCDCESIENITAAGEWILFDEVNVHEYYKIAHKIEILDVLAWVYLNSVRVTL